MLTAARAGREALELREEEPQLWRDLSEWVRSPPPSSGSRSPTTAVKAGGAAGQVSNALEGDADAKAQLKRVFERWAELNELLVGSQKEAMAATGALTWMAGLGGEALVRPRCRGSSASCAADAEHS